MKYVVIVVLLVIMAGAAAYCVNHRDRLPQPGQGAGWMQR